MWVSRIIIVSCFIIGQSRGAPVSRDAIMGLFDAVSGLTHGIGDVLEDISVDDNNDDAVVVVDRKDLDSLESNEELEEEDDDNYDSDEVVDGLFQSLKQFTKQVGKLAHVVGNRLDSRRGNVETMAHRVEHQVGSELSCFVTLLCLKVQSLGDNIMKWKRKNFGIRLNKVTTVEDEVELGTTVSFRVESDGDDKIFAETTTGSPII